MKFATNHLRNTLVLAAATLAVLSGTASAATASDQKLTDDVKVAINHLSLRAPADLTFNVTDGVVNFSGWARNPYEVRTAVDAARSVAGVRKAFGNGVHTWSQ